ncbi:hypothetical protein QPL79_08900 [Ignisphaera sp. 4213-co]|uniref:Roadblock/LC7 domain-containing protein n=1 Tax=Ignisphaera cupida TaxID=3050454 RepID=A0ABD4Z8D7_9CREN|nr:hypothetical protein [Ignisphaera sp. 4213-co]MDK6029480.1 hypothetical protein [Ignisphaera sp. 4213-co]
MYRNIPEAEGASLKTELITRDSVYAVYCDPEEILECNDYACALEIYSTCLADVTGIDINNIRVETIKFVRKGKVIVYAANNNRYCLCVHRYDISGIELCEEVTQICNQKSS